jgi:hypothetical protein
MSEEPNLRVVIGGSVVTLTTGEDGPLWYVELITAPDQEAEPYTSEYTSYRSANSAFDRVVARLKANLSE